MVWAIMAAAPTRAILDEGQHWMQPDKVVPKMKFGTAQSYFTGVEGQGCC